MKITTLTKEQGPEDVGHDQPDAVMVLPKRGCDHEQSHADGRRDK